MKTLKITTTQGVPMNVVEKIICGKRTVIFYDARFKEKFNPELGQPVSSYYTSTLEKDAAILRAFGLRLEGGVPSWDVDQQSMNQVIDWLEA